MKMIYTFWEGEKPAYIDLCMSSWKFNFIELGFHNLQNYTNLDINKLKRLPLQQVSDIVRVHVLRDNGGTWLDADTIAVGELPKETLLGYPKTRENTIGFLNAHKEMFTEWARFQDEIIDIEDVNWSTFGNDFTDKYLKEHTEIKIGFVDECWPETKLSGDNRMLKYQEFYFNRSYHIKPRMLMLHNSWTPMWYKELSRREVLRTDCTLSNILNEIHNNGRR